MFPRKQNHKKITLKIEEAISKAKLAAIGKLSAARYSTRGFNQQNKQQKSRWKISRWSPKIALRASAESTRETKTFRFSSTLPNLPWNVISCQNEIKSMQSNQDSSKMDEWCDPISIWPDFLSTTELWKLFKKASLAYWLWLFWLLF